MAGQGYSVWRVNIRIVIIYLCLQICPQGGQLQPAGCYECADVEEGIQGGRGPATEDAAQHPPQG